MSESNNNPNTDNAFDNKEVGVNESGVVDNNTTQNIDPTQPQETQAAQSHTQADSDVPLEPISLNKEDSEGGYGYEDEYEHEYDEYESAYDEGDQEVGRMPVPGIDDDYYEDYHDGYDPETLEDEELKPLDHSDGSAELLGKVYGVAGVIRENARLSQSVKSTRRQMLMSMGVNIALASLVVAMIVAFGSYPKTRYIPTSDNRAICEVTPENNPNITDVTIADFAKDAILNLYTFDYINHEDQINANLARWFTASGRVDTINAMSAAGITDFVKNNALTLRAGTTAAAKIEQKGRTPTGQPYWVVRFPMVVDVYSGGARPEDSQRYTVSVRVIADNASAQNPKGLGVASAALEPQGQ